MIQAKLTLLILCILLSLGGYAQAQVKTSSLQTQVIETGKFRFYSLL